MSVSDYKSKYSYEHRKKEAIHIKSKYPDRIPIIVEKQKGSNIPFLDKSKFLVPLDLTVGQFIFIIRKRLELKPEQAIFLLANNTLPTNTSLMITVYMTHKDEDQFLYLTVCGHETFGQYA